MQSKISQLVDSITSLLNWGPKSNEHLQFLILHQANNSTIGNSCETPNTKMLGINLQPMNLVRLSQGIGKRIKGTDTIHFICEADIPAKRKKDVTYASFVCNVRPEKTDPNCTRFVAGGDQCNYPYEVATPTTEMLVAKILFNSVISTPGARFMTMDISNFYLMTPLLRPEYIRIKLSDLPEEIIQQYKLHNKPRACMVFHNLAFLPMMSYSRNGLTNMVITKASLCPASGDMNNGLSSPVRFNCR